MIEDAERKGILTPEILIIEPTSGNTGIGLARVASVKGYRLILTMPETMSVERRNLLKALGAEIVLTPGSEGMKGAIRKAGELKELNPGAIILQQFENPANPEAHRHSTALEILSDTDGRGGYICGREGTGGTLSGTSEVLKEHNPAIKPWPWNRQALRCSQAVRPVRTKSEGIGAGFVPGNYNESVVDEVIAIPDNEAIKASGLLAEKEGLLVGISSGAALAGAIREARKKENEGKTIVAILPDTGERYLSTVLYAFDEYPL